MNKQQFSFCLALIACCFFTYAASLTCFVCDSSLGQNCKKPSVGLTCNATLAQRTMDYLPKYTNANVSRIDIPARPYQCIYDAIQTENSTHYYLGCASGYLNVCGYTEKTQGKFISRTCVRCSDYKCNYMWHSPTEVEATKGQ